ncbi:hypothetical protein INT47_004117 [Mucor saturninus]|uniref:Uncharacterized protein n=1 Tax=Mucor saturninus TaxID=64648 RepID=A0A8H7R5I9_9FUNG|nr:hypothetical protein INT47_004117 [Mucor saturninus]
MGNWNHLPHELLDAISFYTPSTFSNAKSMAVNKQWYNFYLSKRFKTVSLALRSTNATLMQILTSPFQPGQWTKTITFVEINTVPDLDSIDYDQDLLDRLMKETPNVKVVRFAEKVRAWAYFLHILKNNHWQLRKIPVTWDKCLAPFYYECAHHVRNTLETLQINEYKFLSDLNFSFLKEFIALNRLYIDDGLIGSPLGLNSILQHTSGTLSMLNVEFPGVSAMGSYREEALPVYPNIKHIQFLDFTPESNDQLSVFTNSFTRLEKLVIVGDIDAPWPGIRVDDDTKEIFYKTLHSLKAYKITVPGSHIDLSHFKKHLTQPVRLFIRNSGPGHYVIGDDKSTTIVKSQYCPYISIRYECIVDNRNRNSGFVPNILQSLDGNIGQVNLREIASNLVTTFLDALLERECVNLHTIVVSDTKLCDYYRNPERPKADHVKTLKFYNCSVSEGSLFSLSRNYFEKLDYLLYNTCTPRKELHWINFRETKIHTLCLSEVEDPEYPRRKRGKTHPCTFVCVNIFRNGMNLRMFLVDQDSVIVETKESVSHEILDAATTNRVSIDVQSIQTIILKSPARKKDVYIDLQKSYYAQ